jgi:transposase-like protein
MHRQPLVYGRSSNTSTLPFCKKAALADLYAAGGDVNEIAKRFGVKPGTIYKAAWDAKQLLTDSSGSQFAREGKMSPEQNSEAARLRDQEHLSFRKISRRVGSPYSSVRRYLNSRATGA